MSKPQFFQVFSWNTSASAKIGHEVTKPRFLNTSMSKPQYFWPLSVSGNVKRAITNAKLRSLENKEHLE